MNYRKWPVQSVLWVSASVLLFAVLIALDLYQWKVQGKPFHFHKFVGYFAFSVVAGWSTTLSGEAKRVCFLTWVAGAVLMQISLALLEGTVLLSPLANAVYVSASTIMPLSVAVGVVLLRRHREEVSTMR